MAEHLRRQNTPGCASQRDLIAKKLKAAQLAEAQRLATDFKPQKESEASK